MLTTRCLLTAAALLLPLTPAALAASADVSSPLEKDVRAKCRQAAMEHLKPVRVVIDATGTGSYALAIAFGKLKNADKRASFVCLYDKTTKTATLGGQMGEDVVRIRMPKKEGANDAAGRPKTKVTPQSPAVPTAKPDEGTGSGSAE